jgi:signal transduction histidine kinase
VSHVSPDGFAAAIALRIQTDTHAIAERWLNRLTALVSVEPNDVFPSGSLLDHIPTLIEGIGKFVGANDEQIVDNTFVVAKARELGELRHLQRASVHQLLREYELLRAVLEAFVIEQSSALQLTAPFDEVMTCVQRINQAVAVLTQTTVDTFVRRYAETLAAQTHRLEGFNRMLSHEFRQPLGVLQTATAVLRATSDADDPTRRDRIIDAIERNVSTLGRLLARITTISGLSRPEDAPSIQRVSVTTVTREAARQLRDVAADRGVQIRIADDLPEIVVDFGELELLFVNLLSNAIKYSDPLKPIRFVDVITPPSSSEGKRQICVRDNGLGMESSQLNQLFTPLYRAHAERDRELGVDGLGLGLTIVQDCARALQIAVTVESTPAVGTTFTLELPADRSEDKR